MLSLSTLAAKGTARKPTSIYTEKSIPTDFYRVPWHKVSSAFLYSTTIPHPYRAQYPYRHRNEPLLPNSTTYDNPEPKTSRTLASSTRVIAIPAVEGEESVFVRCA
jgi:hypothetical protein